MVKKKHFFRYCLQCFFISKVLECHTKYCLAINHPKSVLLPKEGVYITFQNFKRLTKGPFTICGDFECILLPSSDNIKFGPKK